MARDGIGASLVEPEWLVSLLSAWSGVLGLDARELPGSSGGVMESRGRNAFLALMLAQAAHSLEEYLFGLYEVFAPARFVSSLVSDDIATGFAILNVALVAFGAWCYLFRVRPGRASARLWVWPWVLVSLANGITHSTMAVIRGGYFPGVVTAPLLFILAAYIAVELLGGPGRAARPASST